MLLEVEPKAGLLPVEKPELKPDPVPVPLLKALVELLPKPPEEPPNPPPVFVFVLLPKSPPPVLAVFDPKRLVALFGLFPNNDDPGLELLPNPVEKRVSTMRSKDNTQ